MDDSVRFAAQQENRHAHRVSYFIDGRAVNDVAEKPVAVGRHGDQVDVLFFSDADQFGGGIAAVELRPQRIARVTLHVNAIDLERRVVLAYTGAPRNSGTNNWDITKRHIDGDRHVFDCFERIRDAAAALRQALCAGDWEGVARQIDAEWTARKLLAPGVTTPAIDALIARAKAAGARAAKVCGAGGGGCLFGFAEPSAVPAVKEALAAGGARVLEYRIETEGLRVDSV